MHHNNDARDNHDYHDTSHGHDIYGFHYTHSFHNITRSHDNYGLHNDHNYYNDYDGSQSYYEPRTRQLRRPRQP